MLRWAFVAWTVVSIALLVACGKGRDPQTIDLARTSASATAPTRLDVEDAGIVASEPEPTPEPTGGSYVQCDIVHGHVLACAGPAEGRAVLEQRDGTFRGCDLAHGAIVTCGGHGGGVVPVFEGRAYLACQLVGGRIAGCLGVFDGPAVVERIAGSHAHE